MPEQPFKVFIEFSRRGHKILIALDAIQTVELTHPHSDDQETQVNGEEVDQKYEEIIAVMEEWAFVSIERKLTADKASRRKRRD